VIVTRDGVVKVLDLGLAGREAGHRPDRRPERTSDLIMIENFR
jgi:hypothetical protein